MDKKVKECLEGPPGCFKENTFDSAGQWKFGEEKELASPFDAAGKEPGAKSAVTPTPIARPAEDEVITQSATIRFIAYAVVLVLAFVIFLLVINDELTQYLLYADESRIPGPTALFIGTLITMTIVVYTAYILTAYDKIPKSFPFWVAILFLFCYVAWTVNLGVRSDNYFTKSPRRGRGNFYIVMTLFLALALLYYAWNHAMELGLLMLIPIGWILYITYTWIYDGTGIRGEEW